VKKDSFSDGRDLDAGVFDREFFGLCGSAMGANGAVSTVWTGGFTDGLAKLHQRGIQRSRIAGAEDEFTRQLPEFFAADGGVDRGWIVVQSGQNAGDIAIDERFV
jgi:hypothetical protein